MERSSNPVKVDKIVASLNIKVRPQDLRSKDSRNLLMSIFSQWLPLAPSTFRAIVEKIPAPPAAQATRVPKMLHPNVGHSHEILEPTNKLERDLYTAADEDDSFRVAYISKMFAVKSDELPENQRRQLTAEDMRARAKVAKDERDRRSKEVADGIEPTPSKVEKEVEKEQTEEQKNRETLMGFARLYSGTIHVGQTLYAILPKYNAALSPSHPSNAKHVSSVRIEQLYMMMGRELVAVKEVRAGNLFAIRGLEGIVWRNATLCGFGKGFEVKEGEAREVERDCLVNLAGVTQTVRSLSSSQRVLLTRHLRSRPRSCALLSSQRIHVRPLRRLQRHYIDSSCS
jgi:ribosome assembly protein 1